MGGLDPQEAYSGVTQAPQAKPEGFSVARTIGNIPSSAGNLIGGVGSALLHPIRTAKAVGSIAAGGVEKLIPGRQAEEDAFDSLTSFYGNRYGSFEKLLSSVEKDPVGVIADVSTILTAGGAMATKLGTVSKMGALNRVGSAASAAGNATNPLRAVGALTARTKSLFPELSKAIEKSNLRLTKTKEGALATEGIQYTDDAVNITKNRLNDVTDYLAKQKIVGNPLERFAKASDLYMKTEDALDDFFSSFSAGSVVKKGRIIKALDGLKGAYTGNRDIASIKRQIDSGILAVKSAGKGDTVSLGTLNKLKRSTYSNAYNKAGEKVVDGVEHSMGDVFRGILDEDVRGLKIAGQPYEQFMHNYGLLIESRKLLKMAVGKPEIGALTEQVLGGILGYIIGGASPIGWAAGTIGGVALGKGIIESLPITRIKSAVSAAAQSAGETRLPPAIGRVRNPLLGVERLAESQRQ